MEERLKISLEEVLPIIYKEMSKIRINLWDEEDYIQEGRVILYDLLLGGVEDKNLYKYFKTRYNQHLIDSLRSQEASKRGFDKPVYLEVWEHAYMIKDSYDMAEEVSLEVSSQEFISELSLKEQERVGKLLRGESIDASSKSRLKKKFVEFLEEHRK
jgi:hypothetical protein